jgi:hypothetical protein
MGDDRQKRKCRQRTKRRTSALFPDALPNVPLGRHRQPTLKTKKADRDLFDQQLIKVNNDYIGPAIKEAIKRANADLKPPPSVVLHAIFAAAFNACTEAEPDERKAYALFKETAASILDLHSIPSILHGHS